MLEVTTGPAADGMTMIGLSHEMGFDRLRDPEHPQRQRTLLDRFIAAWL
jgi:hypothetical protein